MTNHKKIFTTIIRLLDKEPLRADALISSVVSSISNIAAKKGVSIISSSELRATVSSVLSDMLSDGAVALEGGLYRVAISKPVIIRAEACEREILSVLGSGASSKHGLRAALEEKLGTKNTPTLKDDDILYSYIGRILKRLENKGAVLQKDGVYSIAPTTAARLNDIDRMLALKGEFLSRLHSKGGEFFEHYFMTLVGKYLAKHGKTIIENYTTGGANDGGIDGILKTEDVLGFKETIMVQTKNRLEATNETVVRGFWGAVCAKGGSRGIFATSSDFHEGAREFMDSIDNCIGVDGDQIFKMAIECLYGIKQRDGRYIIDSKIF